MPKGKDEFDYPGDDVVTRAVAETLKEARLAKGMSLDDADKMYRETSRTMDLKIAHRSVALAIKNAREKAGMSRSQLSRKSGVPMNNLILAERAQVNMPLTDFVRVAYALRVKPSVLAEEQERIEQNLSEGKNV
jgi:ribosome-binding protein aMBF1 (putative translation factor)